MGRPKRNVLAAAEASLTPPASLESNQYIVRVVKPEGNNLYACELANKKPIILELAQRFRNTIWIKRGGFVVAERYPTETEETRADGEIINVVRDEKLWRKQSYWPEEFPKTSSYNNEDSEDESNVGKMPPSDSEDE